MRCLINTRTFWSRTALLLVAVHVLTACGTAAYRYETFNPSMLEAQSQTREEGNIRVTAAAPSREQAEAIFGFDIFDRGIQPVWIEIENRSESRKRYAPTGTDREYFSPLEVAYMHRKGYSKEARKDMERRLYGMRMPRRINPGDTESGFVFTNATPGTKGVFIDVFGSGKGDQSFALFLDVPGFVPDHANIDFRNLYEPSEILELDSDGLREAISQAGCCTRNIDGEDSGLPLGILAIGSGRDIQRALLRAGWYETPWTNTRDQVDPRNIHYLFGRSADAKFHTLRGGKNERNELRTWLTPWQMDGQPVWVVLVTHFIGQRTQIAETLFGSTFDPDVDEGRNYLIQNMWYTQSLAKVGWIATGDTIPIEEARTDFNGDRFFTDGHLAVLWLSGQPVSMLETKKADWTDPPPILR